MFITNLNTMSVFVLFVSMSYVTAENWLETMNGLQ